MPFAGADAPWTWRHGIVQAILDDQWKVVESTVARCKTKVMQSLTHAEIKMVEGALNYRKALDVIMAAIQRGSSFDAKGR